MISVHKSAGESRIIFNPAQCGGRPCIRVSDILETLADGVSAETILNDFPDLEPEDISAALRGEARRYSAPCRMSAKTRPKVWVGAQLPPGLAAWLHQQGQRLRGFG